MTVTVLINNVTKYLYFKQIYILNFLFIGEYWAGGGESQFPTFVIDYNKNISWAIFIQLYHHKNQFHYKYIKMENGFLILILFHNNYSFFSIFDLINAALVQL